MRNFLISWVLLAAVTPVLGQTVLADPTVPEVSGVEEPASPIVPEISAVEEPGSPIPETVPAIPTVPAVSTVRYQPDYFLLAGYSFNYYGNTSAGLTTFGVRVADKTYSLTSLDLFARSGNTAAGFRTGVGRILAQPGNWVLMAFGDGGVLKSGGANLGNFSSGLSLSYDVGRRFRKDHIYVSLSVRLVDITSQMVKPIWAISFGKTF